MKKKALIAANISSDFKNRLLHEGYELISLNEKNENLNEIAGIVTSTKLHLDKDTIDRFPALKWIARLGSGVEIIDLDYCNVKGITVASSPAGIANAVAEHCIAQIISLQKNIHSSFLEINHNQWLREANRGYELENKTIGIIGYGHTGMAFAHKLSVFGCHVLAYDKYKTDFTDEYAQEIDLKTLQQKADIISFHVPYNKETHHYYNQAFIANCQSHLLINTSRGSIANTQHILAALKSNKIIGAALDVLEDEQLLQDPKHRHWQVIYELLKQNVIISPHIAGYSHNAIEKMCTELMEKLGNKLSL